jgi:hypothetical protein
MGLKKDESLSWCWAHVPAWRKSFFAAIRAADRSYFHPPSSRDVMSGGDVLERSRERLSMRVANPRTMFSAAVPTQGRFVRWFMQGSWFREEHERRQRRDSCDDASKPLLTSSLQHFSGSSMIASRSNATLISSDKNDLWKVVWVQLYWNCSKCFQLSFVCVHLRIVGHTGQLRHWNKWDLFKNPALVPQY